MPEGVNATVDAMQPTEGDAVLNRTAPEAERPQLTPSYHPVLASCNLGDSPFPMT
jgi:hypothetical protein